MLDFRVGIRVGFSTELASVKCRLQTRGKKRTKVIM